jgi:hypothetical protein
VQIDPTKQLDPEEQVEEVMLGYIEGNPFK